MMKKILAILCIVTLFASIAASTYAAEDDGIIVPLQNFDDNADGTAISSTATSGWKFNKNNGDGSAVVTSDGENKFIKLTPNSSGSNRVELMYLIPKSEYKGSVRLTFKAMLEGNTKTRRIGLKKASDSVNYAFFNNDRLIKAGASAAKLGSVEDFIYRPNVWYNATVDINPADKYVKFTVNDGESTFYTQGKVSGTLDNLYGVYFNMDVDSDKKAWYIDDVKLEKLSENVSEYDVKTIMINNDKFTYMTENAELTGTTTEKWTTSADTEKGASVKILSDNGNKYASITAGSLSYTEFKRTFTSFKNSAVNSIELDFSIKFADKNYQKNVYISGSADKSYITFDTDGKVYIGNATEGYDRNSIPNFTYETDKWYDFVFKFNSNTGLAYISVNDGENIYEALAKDTYTNDDFYRIGFVVDNKMPENTTTTYYIDNIHMQQIDTFNMDYVNISDVTYSADTLNPGTISASLSGQVYGKTEYTLYLAIYTKGQKELVEVDAVPVKAEGFDKTFTASITVPNDENSYEVRAFLFDNNLTPVQTLEVLQ